MNAERVSLLIGRLQRSKLVRLMFGSSMLRGIGLGMTLLTSVALARTLGPAGLGYYSFALAVITVIGLPIHMGLPTLVLRETAKGEANGQWEMVRGLWNWAGRRIIAITLLIFALAIPAIWLFGGRFIPEGGEATVWISFALVPLIAIAQVRGAAVRGLHRPILGLLPDTVIRPFGLVGLLVVVWATGSTITSEVAMELHVVAAVFASIIGIVFLYRVTPADMRGARPDYAAKAEWKGAIWPLALLAGTQIMMQNANILLLGLWQSPEQVGFFKIAVSAANLVIIGLTAVNMVMAPTFAKLYSKNDMRGLQKKASQTALLALAAAIPLITLLAALGREILTFLYGSAFIESYVPLLILMIGQLFSAFFGSSGNLLNMSDNERITLKVMVIAMIVNVALNIVLIPSYGILGSAIATTVSTIGWNIAATIAVRVKLDIDCTPLGMFKKFKAIPDSSGENQ